MKPAKTEVSIFLIVISILFMFSKSSAQTRFGLSAGLNGSTIKKVFNGESGTGKYKLGIQAGLFLEIGILDYWAIQPELNYTQLGAKFEDVDGNNFTSDITFITMPILAKLRLMEFGFYAGPQVGYVFQASDRYTGGTVDMTDYYRKVNLSGVVGAEYVFREHLVSSVRYQLSITDLSKDTEFGPSLKNTAFTFTLGYKF